MEMARLEETNVREIIKYIQEMKTIFNGLEKTTTSFKYKNITGSAKPHTTDSRWWCKTIKRMEIQTRNVLKKNKEMRTIKKPKLL